METSEAPDGRAHQTNEVWLEFGDGNYLFKLRLKQISELQEKCNAGIGAIYARVELGDYWHSDLVETIRLALVGGGKGLVGAEEEEIDVSATTALKLVKRYVEDAPLSELWTLSRAILRACIIGYETPYREKKPGKPQASTTTEEVTGSI